jgi:hypothetical protein
MTSRQKQKKRWSAASQQQRSVNEQGYVIENNHPIPQWNTPFVTFLIYDSLDTNVKQYQNVTDLVLFEFLSLKLFLWW